MATDALRGRNFRTIGREDLPVSKIHPDPEQPRKEFKPKDIQDLADNIEKNSILVPLVVMPFGPDRKNEYLLIDGERRLRAAKKLRLKTVPCTKMAKVEGFDLDVMRFSIHHQRKDWNPFERADKLYQMKMAYGKSLQELSRELSISEQTIRQYLRVRELPQPVRDYAKENKEKFKMSYLTEMVGSIKSLDEKWRDEFPKAEQIIAQKIDSDIIKSPIELRRLKKVFKKNNPIIIRRFFKDYEYSVEDAYIQSGRASEDFERDLSNNVRHLVDIMDEAFKKGQYERAERNLIVDMKKLISSLEQFVQLYEEKQEEDHKKRLRLKKFQEERGLI